MTFVLTCYLFKKSVLVLIKSRKYFTLKNEILIVFRSSTFIYIVAGGWSNETYLKSVEVLIDENDRWKAGPGLIKIKNFIRPKDEIESNSLIFTF
jgi:hypothetical protein